MSNSLALKKEVGGGGAGAATSFELVSVGPAKQTAVCPRIAAMAKTTSAFVFAVLFIVLIDPIGKPGPLTEVSGPRPWSIRFVGLAGKRKGLLTRISISLVNGLKQQTSA